MTKSLFVFALGFLVSTVHAQPRGPGGAEDQLARRGQRTFEVVRRSVLNDQQLRGIHRQLDEIDRLLGYGAPSTGTLRCTSRDNDGRDPWILAIELDPVTVVRLPNLVFATSTACRQSADRARYVGANKTVVCASRDRDARNPYVLAVIDFAARTSTPTTAVLPTLEDCQRELDSARESNAGLALCVSRDNDGRNPWVRMLIRPDGTSQRGSDVYASVTDCRNSL